MYICSYMPCNSIDTLTTYVVPAMHYMCSACISTCTYVAAKVQYNSFCKLPQLPNLRACLTYTHVVQRCSSHHPHLILPAACLNLSSYLSIYQWLTSFAFCFNRKYTYGMERLSASGSCCKIVSLQCACMYVGMLTR